MAHAIMALNAKPMKPCYRVATMPTTMLHVVKPVTIALTAVSASTRSLGSHTSLGVLIPTTSIPAAQTSLSISVSRC